MAERVRAPDQAHRDRIRADLGATLFVEAGAGSGKTSALVDRVVELVVTGTADLRSVAAITFTEKAGAELRDRIRRELAARAAADPAVAERCRAALDQLDGAAIGTLHAFAQRILSEHAVEAGLPPRVEVLDEVTSGVEFEARWRAFRDELLDDPSLERTLLLLLAAGARHEALHALAVAFDQSWDLVDERVPTEAPDPPGVAAALQGVLHDLETLCAERAAALDHDDALCRRLAAVEDYVARLRAVDDELDLLAEAGPGADGRPSFRPGRAGSPKKWSPGTDLDGMRARLRAAGERLDAARDQVAAACAARLGSAIRRFTLGAAAQRRAEGRLEFHDLLVLARLLLRDPVHGATVRRRLHDRYQRLLLDEFQDTDPIQIELAVRIAAASPEDPTTGGAAWHEVPVAPGRLFVVGDPKQSIYRFRRADIATFLDARARYGSDGGLVPLTANFRSAGPVIDWVNQVFGTLLAEAPETDLDVPSQPDYVPLTPVRPAPAMGPAVAVMGRAPHPAGTPADTVREAEAAEVATVVRRVVEGGWSVGDGRGQRPARLGDITVLVPARTSLPFLEDALDAAGIAYRAEASSLVYATRAVRDLLMVVRAADDPTDHLSIVAALRTPLLACGDDDLFRFRVERRGSWSYLADQPGTVPSDDPVRAGLAYLAGLHAERRWVAPSVLLDRVVRERRLLELGFADGRPRDLWRRVRFVVDQARAWSDATGGTLRGYLRWVALQTQEGARVAEAVLPETDDDAVRIMTIHAAKGLQFPVTVVSGLSTRPGGRPAAAQVAFPPAGGVAYRMGARVVSPEFAEWMPIDEQMAYDERIRLLYVACTRAEDHLVVSLHRCERASEPAPTRRTNAELLLAGMAGSVGDVPDAVPEQPAVEPLAPIGAPPPAEPSPLDAWAATRQRALEAASRRRTVSATALTDEGGLDAGAEAEAGLQKRPRDLDLPPWLRGRYGTAVGRAVHGVLQVVDLATGAGLDPLVDAQCQAEAIPGRAGDVRRLVQTALGAAVVREAAARPHWRELYACVPGPDGRLLEGYVDLLYRGDGGLVVVDHKTAATADPAVLGARLDAYRAQGASYALAVAEATGERVARVVFLFLTTAGAVERELPDLDAAVEGVRALLSAGAEVEVPQPEPELA